MPHQCCIMAQIWNKVKQKVISIIFWFFSSKNKCAFFLIYKWKASQKWKIARFPRRFSHMTIIGHRTCFSLCYSTKKNYTDDEIWLMFLPSVFVTINTEHIRMYRTCLDFWLLVILRCHGNTNISLILPGKEEWRKPTTYRIISRFSFSPPPFLSLFLSISISGVFDFLRCRCFLREYI